MNIFVGNLLFQSSEADLKKLFEGFGSVVSAVIAMEKQKKAPKSRGFGFVQMPNEQEALAAIAALNGKEFMGRVLNVNPARANPTAVGLPKAAKERPKVEVYQKKVEVYQKNELKRKTHSKFEDRTKNYPRKEAGRQKAWFSPVFDKSLTLKDKQVRPSGRHLALEDRQVRPSGRHLALEDRQVRPSGRPGRYRGGRRTLSYISRNGLSGTQEEAKRTQDNPMRWRKRGDQPKPWSKNSGHPSKSRPNSSMSLGMVRESGKYSQTKVRRKPGRSIR